MTEPIDRIVREPERRSITGIGPTKCWEMEKTGEHPRRVVITGRITGWRLSELQEFVRSRQPKTKPTSPPEDGATAARH